MPGKVAVPTERVPLVATATGETVLVWPVDAREMLANGDYVTPQDATAQAAAVVTGGEATGEPAVAAVVPDVAVTEPPKRRR
jgi:hypothetical protein